MEGYKSYMDLDAWQQSRELNKMVYKLTKEFPSDEQFVLKYQMRKCAISVPSNIAEGIGRLTTKDTINFLSFARGSLYELETQLVLAFDLEYMTKEELDEHLRKVTKCKQLLSGLINYYQSKL